MTIQQALTHSPLDQLDTELLLAYILKQDRMYVKAHGERRLRTGEQLRLFWCTNQRKRNVPLAYITGTKEFYGLSFFVNKHTLVPRPETEQIISRVTSHVSHTTGKPFILIDVGTGSGCIPIAVQRTMSKEQRANIQQTFAIDISRKALAVAKKNAKKHGVTIQFLHGNLLDPINHPDCSLLTDHCSVIITANLPYLTQAQFEEEPSIQREPKSALVAKENGLALYRELLEQLHQIFNIQSSIFNLHLFLEIDPSQTTDIQTFIERLLPNARATIHADGCGRDRIVEVEMTM